VGDLPEKKRGIRASDAEREVVVRWLAHAFQEGRLDLAEYDERVQRAYAAKTHGDLEPLTDDLPRPGNLPRPGPKIAPKPAARTASRPSDIARLLIPCLLLALCMTGGRALAPSLMIGFVVLAVGGIAWYRKGR
jgi:uncharacterized protein DUF1707